MLRALNRLIIRVSGSGWLVLAAALTGFACLTAMNRIAADFPAVAGGAVPFDLQNDLTSDQVLAQLAGYTDGARRLYGLFTAIDYLFPFAAGLFLAGISAFGMRWMKLCRAGEMARYSSVTRFLAYRRRNSPTFMLASSHV